MAIKGLRAWVDKLSQIDMPVLANVIKELNELTGSDEAEVNQLSEVILKDANLTSQVLRIANSVQYNHSGYPINTVSRAIVLIGFEGVRAICISVMVIESLLKNEPRDRLLEDMAFGFHAAVQARCLLKFLQADGEEEVFIAALLFHLGDMAFWACGAESADRLDDLLKSGTTPHSEAIKEVTGTSFKLITQMLAEIWKLGETLQQSLDPPRSPSSRVIAVRLGEELSRCIKLGWDCEAVEAVLRKMAKFMGVSVQQAKQMAKDAADEAAQVAVAYGAGRVSHFLPNGKKTSEQKTGKGNNESAILQADPQLQLNILRELTSALTEELDVNTIFQMVMEGIHRGVGLERVAVGFIQKDFVKARYILGEGTERWREHFNFPLNKPQKNIFTYAIDENEPVWLNNSSQSKHLYTPEVLSVIGSYPAFIGKVTLGKRTIALLYCDRWKLGGSLDKDQFSSFRHFVLQTKFSLQMLTQKK